MINIMLLQAFLSVAEFQNLTIASANLGISQPALSYRIRLLEEKTGQGLFIRKKTGMELTDFGTKFLSICKKLQEDVKYVDCWIKDQHPEVGGTVRITAVSGVINHILLEFFERFTQRYPETKISARENATTVSEEQILAGSFDFGIITDQSRKYSLKSILLFEHNELLLVCSPEYLKKCGHKIMAEHFEPEEILWYVDMRSRSAKKIIRFFNVTDPNLMGKIQLPDMEACKQYAMKGLGATITSKLFVWKELKGGGLVSVPGFRIKLPMHMISRGSKYQSRAALKFKEEFSDYCRDIDSRLKDI